MISTFGIILIILLCCSICFVFTQILLGKKVKKWHIFTVVLLGLFSITPFRQGFFYELAPLIIIVLILMFLEFLLKNPHILFIGIIILIAINYTFVHSKTNSVPGVYIITHYDYLVNPKVIVVNIYKEASFESSNNTDFLWNHVDQFLISFLDNIKHTNYEKIIFRYRFKHKFELSKKCYDTSSNSGIEKILNCVTSKNGILGTYRVLPYPNNLLQEIEHWANIEKTKIEFYQEIGVIPGKN